MPASRIDRGPLLFGIRLRYPRIFMNPRHVHLEIKMARWMRRRTRNRRGADRIWCARERYMTFTREQSGGRIEPDPACARQKHFRPRMQVGEVFRRSDRAFEWLHIGLELNYIARCKPRR